MNKLKKNCATKDYKGFSLLTKGYHEIETFRLVDDKYSKESPDGEKKKVLLVELKNEVLFLSKHFANNLTESDISSINSFTERMYLYFGGRAKNNK